MAVRGVLKSVKTMKMEKIWRVDPVMYIPVRRNRTGQLRVLV